MQKLPQQLTLDMLQTRWASIIDPALAKPILDGQLLENINLTNGTTIINHRLGRKLRGWLITDIDSAASIHRVNASNTPELTLSLSSDASAIISLWVF
jgi:hypothetical protein